MVELAPGVALAWPVPAWPVRACPPQPLRLSSAAAGRPEPSAWPADERMLGATFAALGRDRALAAERLMAEPMFGAALARGATVLARGAALMPLRGAADIVGARRLPAEGRTVEGVERTLGTDERMLGAEERMLGAAERALGIDERMLGADERALGIDERMLGAGRMLPAERLTDGARAALARMLPPPPPLRMAEPPPRALLPPPLLPPPRPWAQTELAMIATRNRDATVQTMERFIDSLPGKARPPLEHPPRASRRTCSFYPCLADGALQFRD
jgi:hypothetical protein